MGETDPTRQRRRRIRLVWVPCVASVVGPFSPSTDRHTLRVGVTLTSELLERN